MSGGAFFEGDEILWHQWFESYRQAPDKPIIDAIYEWNFGTFVFFITISNPSFPTILSSIFTKRLTFSSQTGFIHNCSRQTNREPTVIYDWINDVSQECCQLTMKYSLESLSPGNFLQPTIGLCNNRFLQSNSGLHFFGS